MPRWVYSVIALAIGLGLGLLYGWVISPVQFVDTTPASMRADYRADYVLMIAEAYQADHNTALAIRRLSVLGGGSPADIGSQAIQTGQNIGYSADDISLLQELRRALQAYQPAPPTMEGTP
jgi:hypothetical protein